MQYFLAGSATNSTAHSKEKAEGSHRAGRGDPLQLDFSIDVSGVAGEGETLVPGKNHSFGGLQFNHRRSNGDWEEIKTNGSESGGVEMEVKLLNQRCTYTHVFTPLYLVLLSGSSHVIWRTLPSAFPCTHSNLRRPSVCCGWRCLAPGLQKTGDQRPELFSHMFPGAGCPDSDQLPGRGWKQCLPHEWECWTPSIFWKDCRDLPKENAVGHERWCQSCKRGCTLSCWSFIWQPWYNNTTLLARFFITDSVTGPVIGWLVCSITC